MSEYSDIVSDGKRDPRWSRQTTLKDIPHPAKPQWQGLTDDELMEILGYVTHGYIPDYTRNFVDAIEAKLKEKNA